MLFKWQQYDNNTTSTIYYAYISLFHSAWFLVPKAPVAVSNGIVSIRRFFALVIEIRHHHQHDNGTPIIQNNQSLYHKVHTFQHFTNIPAYSVVIIVVYITRFLLCVLYFTIFSTEFEARHKCVSTRKCSSSSKHGVCFWVEPHRLKLDTQVRWQIPSVGEVFQGRGSTNLRLKITHCIADTRHVRHKNTRHVMVELAN